MRHRTSNVPFQNWSSRALTAINVQELHNRNSEEAPSLPIFTNNSHIATLVERHSRFATLIQVPSKDTAAVVAALTRHVLKLPATLRRSLTWDRGLEMASTKPSQ